MERKRLISLYFILCDIFVVLHKFLYFVSPISRSWNGLIEYLRGIIGRVKLWLGDVPFGQGCFSIVFRYKCSNCDTCHSILSCR